MQPRKTAADFHPEVLRWFDKYVHGQVDRRGFLEGVGKYAVGGATATGILEALQPQFAQAQVVKRDDPRIDHEQGQVGFLQGQLGLTAHPRLKALVADVLEAGGIDQFQVDVADPAGAEAPVTGHARPVIDDR